MRRWAAWGLALMVVFVAWAGWRAHDYRAAVREAEALGWEWNRDEPWDLIREDWRLAFEKDTWKKGGSLELEKAPESPEQMRLVHRLNPTVLYTPAPRDLSSLQGLSGLEELAIGSETMTDLNGLEKLPRLTKLVIAGSPRLETLDGVSKLKALETVTISDCATLQSLRGLSELPKLNRLELLAIYLPEMRDLGQPPGLRSIFLTQCPKLASLREIGAQANLTMLELRRCPELPSLKGLAGLKQLEVLCVADCPALASLDGLQDTPKLITLILTGCPKLDDFERVRGLSALSSLLFEKCPQLRDTETVSGLGNLRELHLAECQGLDNFDGVKKLLQLSTLVVRQCPKFSESVRAELAGALPTTNVVSQGNGVVWREEEDGVIGEL
jgi:Leucine-rich repeat (LRR) protein